MSVHEHRSHAKGAIRCFVATASDSRTEATDETGAYLRQRLAVAGHEVVGYRIIRDEAAEVASLLEAAANARAEALLVNGGTGIGRRDVTYDALAQHLDKRLDGFGEIFRALSFQEIGAAAMMSRAVAGVAGDLLVVSLPGSPAAVRLAWEKLLEPELAHMVSVARR